MKKKNKDHEKGFHGPTFVIFDCPNCGKRRMYRPESYKPSDQKQWSADKKKQRHIDVCDACYLRYANDDAIFVNKTANVAKEALENKENMPEGVSIEDGLLDNHGNKS